MSSSAIRIRSFPLPALLVMLLVGVSFAGAQNFRGGINGTVTDQGGGSLPGAQVQITDEGTGITQATVSSSAGEYSFPNLPLGLYTVSATSSGFETLKVEKVQVSAGSTYSLPLKLAVASQSTTVEVNAAGVALDTTSVTQTTVLPTRTIQDSPINGRDFTQFLGLTPGFAGYSQNGGAGFASVNGTRTNSVNWQIEGTDNNDLWWNIPAVNQGGVNGIAGIVLPIDAIDQFSFVTSSSPETGRNAGGTANLVIKSGTNQFHGTLYDFNRNEALAANTPFANGSPKNEDRFLVYGFSVGGPIIKDKTFFFVTYEHNNFVIGNQSRSTEPSAAYQAASEGVLAYYGIPVNPLSTTLLANLWPADALTGPASANNYYNTAPLTGHSFNGIAKIDENFTAKDHLSFKIFMGQGNQVAPTTSFLTPYYEEAPIHVYNYSLVYNRVVSPSIVNQLFLGVNYYNQVFSDANHSYNPVALGLNTGVTAASLSGAPRINISAAGASSGLSASNSGFDPTGPTVDSGRNDITGHIDDALSWTKGAHEYRFGGEYRQAQVDDFYQSGQRGTFTFDGSQGPWTYGIQTANGSAPGATACDALATKNLGTTAPGYTPTSGYDSNVLSLADFLAGCFTSPTNNVEGDPKRQVFENTWSIFAQDAWQVNHHFNFNYGVRYDYSGPIHSQYHDLTSFDPTAPNGLAVAGVNRPNIYQQYYGSVSPRIGFAYQPFGMTNTVVRGGFGMFYEAPYMVPFLNLRGTVNGGPFGVQDNPAGVNPVASANAQVSIWSPGQLIFTPLAEAIAGAGVINLFAVNYNFRPAYTYTYNLNIQQSFGPNIMMQIGYVGTNARHLLDVRDINQAALGSGNVGVDVNQYTYQQTTRPYFSQFPNYAVINQVESEATSNYDSLQTLLRTTNWHRITTQLTYTWSHSLDEESGLIPYMPQNSFNLKGEYGNSDFDVTNTFSAYASYDVPGSARGPRWLTNGWQLNSLWAFHGGLPFSVTATNQNSGNGESADRANQIGNPFAGVSHQIVNGSVQWFNTAAFADPALGTYGTSARGAYRNPGFEDIDLSVFKNTKITERISLQLRIEMFNILNHTNLAPAGQPSTSDSGGTIGSTFGAYAGAPGIGVGEPFNTNLGAKIIF
jgi:Carboxypeptidase regulatory-like domain/TonB dependent receptor